MGGRSRESNYLQIHFRDFPGGPVIKTPCFQYRGVGLSRVRELMLHGMAKRKEITLGIELILLLVKAETDFFFNYFFLIYLFYLASPGLNCSTQHLLVAAYGI